MMPLPFIPHMLPLIPHLHPHMLPSYLTCSPSSLTLPTSTHSSFHFQTSLTNCSLPMSCRDTPPSLISFFSTTTWVAIPAWSHPGFHRTVFPFIRCLGREDERGDGEGGGGGGEKGRGKEGVKVRGEGDRVQKRKTNHDQHQMI